LLSLFQWPESNDTELYATEEDVVRRSQSEKAVLLLLREELQQMSDFIDSLRTRQTIHTASLDLGDHGKASGIAKKIQQGLGHCSPVRHYANFSRLYPSHFCFPLPRVGSGA